LFERRYTSGKAELLRPFADELVQRNVDLIVTNSTDSTLAARNATKTIPIVFRSAGDPVRLGLVASLARPGGNATGYSIVASELSAKGVALLREMLPGIQRIGVLENSNNPFHRTVRNELEHACRLVGIEPIFIEVLVASELENAIGDVARKRGQALIVPTDLLFYDNGRTVVRTALKHALPTMIDVRIVSELGALFSYEPNEAEQNQRAAALMDKILRGAHPSTLPVEQPTKFDLVINLKTAKALGITIPQSLILRAEVIQ
jgi:putative tryptophan/tyrosine transport system substrate-binding protein